MPKATKDKPKTKAYLPRWEQEAAFKGWLSRNTHFKTDPKGREAFCLYCCTPLKAHHFDLLKHQQTKTHIDSAKGWKAIQDKRQKELQDHAGYVVHNKENKRADICLAVHIAAHSSLKSIDHLGELLQTLGAGSVLGKTRMHRTKCAKIIVNVVAPALLKELVEDIGDEGYSLLADESSDVSVIKYLAFFVRYFSKKKDIVTDFLGMVQVDKATGEILGKATLKYLEKIGLKPENMLGFGSDNAANMTGHLNGCFAHLKRVVPHLILIRCTCHSLHLCACEAALKMPADLEFLVRETRTWFVRSPLKTANFQTLFATINNGKMPLKLIQLVATRWLAWGKAIDVIILQWLELKLHFNLHVASLSDSEKCTVGRKLNELYNDDRNLLYLLFLKPIVAEISKVNLAFQAENAEVTKLFGDLRSLLVSLLRKFIKPAFIRVDGNGKFLNDEDFNYLRGNLNNSAARLPLNSIDYGASFAIQLDKTQHGNSPISPPALVEVQSRCVAYLTVLCNALIKRLPDHGHLYEALRYLAPDECMKKFPHRASFLSLPLFLRGENVDVDALKSQWDKMTDVNWSEYFPNEDEVPKTSSQFWCKVAEISDASGPMFPDLAKFALRILSLPFSNAAAERGFSCMNCVKSKARNKMSIPVLIAIMRVRLRFGVLKLCCNKFEPSLEMYKLFSANMYDKVLEDGVQSQGEQGDVQSAEDTEITDFEEILNLFHLGDGEVSEEIFMFQDEPGAEEVVSAASA